MDRDGATAFPREAGEGCIFRNYIIISKIGYEE